MKIDFFENKYINMMFGKKDVLRRRPCE